MNWTMWWARVLSTSAFLACLIVKLVMSHDLFWAAIVVFVGADFIDLMLRGRAARREPV